MPYQLKTTVTFRREAKRCKKRGLPMKELWDVVSLLLEQGSLPAQYLPHPLHGKYEGHMECHIRPDWLLIWQQNDKELILCLTNTGTHSDLFGKLKRKYPNMATPTKPTPMLFGEDARRFEARYKTPISRGG